jgi:hypothetical protein
MDVCSEHSKMIGDVGEIKGIVHMIKEGQDAVFERLDKLAENGVNQRVQAALNQGKQDVNQEHNIGELAKDRVKIKPLYWALGFFGAVILERLAEIVISKLKLFG